MFHCVLDILILLLITSDLQLVGCNATEVKSLCKSVDGRNRLDVIETIGGGRAQQRGGWFDGWVAGETMEAIPNVTNPCLYDIR
jgi:hypothetical protein